MKFLTNKITVRWLTILNVLERKRNCSSQQITEFTQLSTRTLINEIKDIREYFEDSIELTTNNMGYVFKERDHEKYTQKKREMVQNDPLFIVLQSILDGDLRSTEEWAFTFHVSESTMKRYILSVVPTLEEYGLQFSLTPVDLVGSEVNIRKFFKDFYYEIDLTPRILMPFRDMEEFVIFLEEERIKVKSDISPADFRYFLYIMIQRSKNGRAINSSYINLSYTDEERFFLGKLKATILATYNYEVSDDELKVMYFYYLSRRRLTDVESEKNYCSRFNDRNIENKLAKEFIYEYDETLLDNQVDITYFIEAFFVSIKLLDSIGSILNRNNPNILSFVQSKYLKEFTRTNRFLDNNIKSLGVDTIYVQDISANLVLTIEAIRDMYVDNHLKIAFLLEGSYYFSQAIKAKTSRYLRGYHQLFFLTIDELTNHYFEINQIDILVTNQEEYVASLTDTIDYVLFKTIPDKEDWSNLLERINPNMIKDFSLGETLIIE